MKNSCKIIEPLSIQAYIKLSTVLKVPFVVIVWIDKR